jgi:hypothetical protein
LAQRNTLDHIAFRCTGLAALQARLLEMGLTPDRDQVPDSRARQLFVTDPAGNGVELLFPDGA